MTWDAGSIKALLEEAADTLRRWRTGGLLWPAGARSAWPDVVQSFWDIAGKREQGPAVGAEEDRPPLLPPSKAAIDRLDVALPLIYAVDPRNRRREVVWLAALGVPHARIAHETGRHRNTVARIYANECARLAALANAGETVGSKKSDRRRKKNVAHGA